jgi:hypothetical protein
MRTPDIGIANWFLPRALRAPERRALAFEGETWTYAQMQHRIEQLAGRFAFAAAIAASFLSPAVSDELRPLKYKVTVLEQVHHKITVEADEERAARTVALLEARRTSGSPNPAWRPSLPSVLAHVHEANDFAVIDIEPLPSHATPEPIPGPIPLEWLRASHTMVMADVG